MEVISAVNKLIWKPAHNDIAAILLQTLNFLSDNVETNEELRLKKLKSLQALALKVVHICHSKYQQAGKPSTQPPFWDALAALLSVYLDIAILINRKSPGEVCVKKLCRVITFFLAERPIFLLDVLIQTNCPSEETAELDSCIIAALCRRWIPIQKSLADPQNYTKLVGVVKLRCMLYPTELADVIQESREVKAPKKYLQWLEEQNPKILDDIPVTPKLKLRRLTRFFLNEASTDLIENILDLITSGEFSEDKPEESEAVAFEIDVAGSKINREVNGEEATEERIGGYLIDKSAAVITEEILEIPDSEEEEKEEGEEHQKEEEEEEEAILIVSGSEEDEKEEEEGKMDVMKMTLSSLNSLIHEARRRSSEPAAEKDVLELSREEVVNISDEEMETDEQPSGNVASPVKEVPKISPKKITQEDNEALSPKKTAGKSPSPKKKPVVPSPKPTTPSPRKAPSLEVVQEESSPVKSPRKSPSPVKSPRKILMPKLDQTPEKKISAAPSKIANVIPAASPQQPPSASKNSESNDRVPTPMRRSARKRQSIIPDLASVYENDESSSGQENKGNKTYDITSESDWSPKGMGCKARTMLQHIKAGGLTPIKQRRLSLTEPSDAVTPVSGRRMNTRSRLDSLHRHEEDEEITESKPPEVCWLDSPGFTKTTVIKDYSKGRRKSMPASKVTSPPASPVKTTRRESMGTRRSQRILKKQ